MPSPYIKNLSKETGKSTREIEKLWDKAKKIASEEFGKPESEFGEREYKYSVGVVKNMLGVEESVMDPMEFLKSDMDARKYIETVVSGDFPHLNKSDVNMNDKEEEEEDDEEEGTKAENTRFGEMDWADLEKGVMYAPSDEEADEELIDPNGMSQPDREADSDVPYDDDEMDGEDNDNDLTLEQRKYMVDNDLTEEQVAAMDELFKQMQD